MIRHPFIIRLRTGVNKDGKINAIDAKVIVDNGAYSSYGPLVAMQSGLMLCSLYRDMAFSYDVSLVYTNKVRSGAMRGFGTAQITFAAESHMDMIADNLSIDPVFRWFLLSIQINPNNYCGHLSLSWSIELMILTIKPFLAVRTKIHQWIVSAVSKFNKGFNTYFR